MKARSRVNGKGEEIARQQSDVDYMPWVKADLQVYWPPKASIQEINTAIERAVADAWIGIKAKHGEQQ